MPQPEASFVRRSGGRRDPLDLDGMGEPGEVGHPAHGRTGVADRQVPAGEPRDVTYLAREVLHTPMTRG